MITHSCGNESYCFNELSIKEKQILLLLLEMVEETFIKVYQVNLEVCYLHILIVFFHADLRIFTKYINLGNKGYIVLK